MRQLSASYRSAVGRRALVASTAAVVAIVAWRSLLPAPTLGEVGFSLINDHLFSLAIVTMLLLAAWGLGAIVLEWLAADLRLDRTLRLALAISLGLGVLSLLLFGLGVVGLFRSGPLAGLLLGAFAALSPVWLGEVLNLTGKLRPVFARLQQQSPLVKLSLAAVAVTSLMAGLQALTPPWTFDALMYHLEAPSIYLEHGRLLLLPDLWQANGPLAIEMLYAVGLAFDSAAFSRLTHLLLTGLLVLTTYSFGNRWLGARPAFIAVLLLFGIPIFPIWGSIANIDSGWALYEFVGLACLICWAQSGERGWALLSGASLGMAMATKYVALAALLPAALLLMVRLRQADRRRWWAEAAGWAALAALFAGPWYLLNLFRAGNPVYPFVFGGPGWGPERLQFLTAYLSGFGGGNRLASFLLAPIWLFTRRELYTTFMSGIELPSILFPLALLIPFLRLDRPLKLLGLATLARLVGWGLSTQQTRFLLPLYPAFALLTAAALIALHRRLPLRFFFTTLGKGLIGGLLLTATLYQLVFWLMIRPGGVLGGTESRQSFLRRNNAVYGAQAYVQSTLPANAKVLMLWDSQTFYCDDRCVGDAEQSIWTQIVADHADPAGVTDALRLSGYTHLLGSLDSLNFFLRHDPDGLHTRAADFYLDVYRPSCTEPLYGDGKAVVDDITCE